MAARTCAVIGFARVIEAGSRDATDSGKHDDFFFFSLWFSKPHETVSARMTREAGRCKPSFFSDGNPENSIQKFKKNAIKIYLKTLELEHLSKFLYSCSALFL